MVHTSYHLTVSAAQLPGALDRLGRFFTDPLLLPDSILKEVGRRREKAPSKLIDRIYWPVGFVECCP